MGGKLSLHSGQQHCCHWIVGSASRQDDRWHPLTLPGTLLLQKYGHFKTSQKTFQT
jgi:hypothetical protein